MSETLAQEVDNALSDGALNGDTSNVVIQIGFNDAYGWLLGKAQADGLDVTSSNLPAIYADEKNRWDAAVGDAIDRIKAAAPMPGSPSRTIPRSPTPPPATSASSTWRCCPTTSASPCRG